MQPNASTQPDLILSGVGHASKRFGAEPVHVARAIKIRHSGMLAGHVAGYFRFDKSHIDLAAVR